MKDKLEQIEHNLNSFLDIYDRAMRDARESNDIKKEKHFEAIAVKATDCINHEMEKLKELKGFSEEIKITTYH